MDIISTTYQRFGIQLKKTGHDEYHGACPFCGEGKDRFIVWEEGNFYCRQCEKTGWINERDRQWKPAPESYKRAIARIEQQKREQAARLFTWQQHLTFNTILEWHNSMDAMHRDYWHRAGITDDNIEYHSLGYCPSKKVKVGEQLLTIPAYTIPILDPESRQLVNVQYRLENPPPQVGRYRQEAGIPAAAFYSTPDLDGHVIIVEGAKKAIVVSQLVQNKTQVVGLPGITPSESIINRLRQFKTKWLIPDPGVKESQIQPFRERLERLHIVTLPDKVDDCILRYGLNFRLFRQMLKGARVM